MLLVGVAVVLGMLCAFLLLPRNQKSNKIKESRPSSNSKKVYDVTSYVEEHPGGDAILTHAGEDSTEGFYGPQHATRVFHMIEDFYIGDLKE